MHPLKRYSVGDWISCLCLVAIGLYLDRAKPFEQYVANRVNDPSISYPHTPKDRQQVTTRQLMQLALFVPVGTIVLYQCVQRRRRNSGDLNQALLGLLSSLALTLTLVCFVKNNVGRLRPDFLARCKPVGGECSRAGDEVLEGRKSFPSGHTALSFAGLGYLALYLGAKLGHMHGAALAGHLWKVVVAGAPPGWKRGASLRGAPWLLALWVGGVLGHACAYAMYRLRYPNPALGCDPHVASANDGGKGNGSGSAADGGESETTPFPI